MIPMHLTQPPRLSYFFRDENLEELQTVNQYEAALVRILAPLQLGTPQTMLTLIFAPKPDLVGSWNFFETRRDSRKEMSSERFWSWLVPVLDAVNSFIPFEHLQKFERVFWEKCGQYSSEQQEQLRQCVGPSLSTVFYYDIIKESCGERLPLSEISDKRRSFLRYMRSWRFMHAWLEPDFDWDFNIVYRECYLRFRLTQPGLRTAMFSDANLAALPYFRVERTVSNLLPESQVPTDVSAPFMELIHLCHELIDRSKPEHCREGHDRHKAFVAKVLTGLSTYSLTLAFVAALSSL